MQRYGVAHLLVQGLTQRWSGSERDLTATGGSRRAAISAIHTPSRGRVAGRIHVSWDGLPLRRTIAPSGTDMIRVRATAEDGQKATGIGMLHAAR